MKAMGLEKECAAVSEAKIYNVATLIVEIVRKAGNVVSKTMSLAVSFTNSANESNVGQQGRYNIGVNRQSTVVVTDKDLFSNLFIQRRTVFSVGFSVAFLRVALAIEVAVTRTLA
ncbi:hypothetical protein H6F86_01600 [Phormidium sp. FACHB-592]|uniref:Uncharacterized protein n=1 Tax=Stenomitos frigidus AS-A4 TaxID=2933935 RepID=A0ABV0KM31_9CYAN|nr:hypothetical protein [Phormidium sp. FACHB-592]MBD2072600.1 hypothetical protein [Phormidium sp. FACHB-592]